MTLSLLSSAIALPDEEAPGTATLRLRREGGLCYLDERPEDRDTQGVLWARGPRTFAALEPFVSPRRGPLPPAPQRESMEALRCPDCAVQPASRTESGYLFLVAKPEGRTPPGWPEGVLARQPPLCLACARAAPERAQHGAVAVRARFPRLYGVVGTLYTTGADRLPVPVKVSDEVKNLPLSYRDRLLSPWFLASQLVRELHGASVVDLTSERATRP